MKKSAILSALVMFLMLFALSFGCGGGDSEEVDGDGGDGLPFGSFCSTQDECSGDACYAGSVRSYCSLPCTSDDDCVQANTNSELTACCERVESEGRNLCMLGTDCGEPSDGDDSDGDDDLEKTEQGDGDSELNPDGDVDRELAEGQICWPNEYRCENNWVQVCQTSGKAWEDIEECIGAEICDGGRCVIPDGDVDGDVEDICGNSDIIPPPIYRKAESIFNPAKSTPILAEIKESLNLTEFEDKQFVFLKAEEIGQVVAFDFDVDYPFYYSIYIDYVKHAHWGEASLYIDNYPDPILLTPEHQPNNRISLHDDKLAAEGSEARLRLVSYEPICISEGEHTLYVKVYGKVAKSQGYYLGVDVIAAQPYIPSEDGDEQD